VLHGNENDSLVVGKSNTVQGAIQGDAVSKSHQNFLHLHSPGSGVEGPEQKNCISRTVSSGLSQQSDEAVEY